MEIANSSVINVLRKVTAAKVLNPEEKGREDIPAEKEPQKADIPPKEANTIRIINRVYFYSIDPNKKISFSNLHGIMSGTDERNKQELLENLKGGNSADYNADYFKWRTLMVKAVSQQDESKVVVYEYDLNPWGTKASEGKMVKTTVANFNPPTPADIVSDSNFKLFATINEIPDMVNLSQGPEAIYSLDNVSDAYANKLLSNRAESTVANKMNYDSFKNNVFAYYRIWVPITANQLRNVDGSKPTTDQLPPELQKQSPGFYKGGGTFFKKFMASGKYKIGEKEETPTETEPESKLKSVKEPEFTPATKESSMKEAMIKEINEDDPYVNQYTGDMSIMQDLVKAQHKKMKIRKVALIPGSVRKPGMVNVQIPIEDYTSTKKVTKALEDTSKKMEALKRGIPTGTGTQPTTTSVSQGTSMGKFSSEHIKNVLKNYFVIKV